MMIIHCQSPIGKVGDILTDGSILNKEGVYTKAAIKIIGLATKKEYLEYLKSVNWRVDNYNGGPYYYKVDILD